jgi:hypothetical protein
MSTARHRDRKVSRALVRESRDGLQRVLQAIRTGELTASAGYIAHLEGAVSALDALLGGPRA